MGRFSGYVDHLLKKLQHIFFIGQPVKTDIAGIFLPYQIGDDVDKGRFSVVAVTGQEE
ncbi:MAG: hypothetical protein BWX92_03794 [Deltaproteobacteria bacterium ADurb.Bin135]|nr:MAG: hypothetical protein BWX92_03794 [Deltaproteobacteria bacterium ADurb.Bin135]